MGNQTKVRSKNLLDFFYTLQNSAPAKNTFLPSFLKSIYISLITLNVGKKNRKFKIIRITIFSGKKYVLERWFNVPLILSFHSYSLKEHTYSQHMSSILALFRLKIDQVCVQCPRCDIP